MTCHVCKKTGHFARDCPDFRTVGAIDEEEYGNFEEQEDEGWYEEEWYDVIHQMQEWKQPK